MCSFPGMPFNQLGTLAGSKFYNVEATYYYLRWWERGGLCVTDCHWFSWATSRWGEIFNLCVMCTSIQSEAPFEGAYGNLKRLFDKAAKMYQQVKKQEMKKLSPARQRWQADASMRRSNPDIYGSTPVLKGGQRRLNSLQICRMKNPNSHRSMHRFSIFTAQPEVKLSNIVLPSRHRTWASASLINWSSD